ncbi:hypothetical protein Q5427_10855 [Brochothrix thermosphacta]|uniref:hypothetical protein n=1 Tax=Brochothrix thermosphacta TaxID=2756 RepID=UPI002714296E|nr:hypothetical protein [Brochothrix thermosphacta]MDO7864789.1 hypothetical protein [Brochothrix thermosphacta]
MEIAIGILIGGTITYLLHIPLIKQFEKDLDWAYKNGEEWADKTIKAKESHVTALESHIKVKKSLYSRINKLEEKGK